MDPDNLQPLSNGRSITSWQALKPLCKNHSAIVFPPSKLPIAIPPSLSDRIIPTSPSFTIFREQKSIIEEDSDDEASDLSGQANKSVWEESLADRQIEPASTIMHALVTKLAGLNLEFTSQSRLAQNFLLFPKLPPELRLYIWELAMPEATGPDKRRIIGLRGLHDLPRDNKHSRHIVRLQAQKQSKKKIVDFCVAQVRTGNDHGTSPEVFDVTLLQACQESRHVYLKRYPYSIPTRGGGDIRFNEQSIIFFENGLDCLYAMGCMRQYRIWAQQVKYLALTSSTFARRTSRPISAIPLIFNSLEQLICVAHPSTWGHLKPRLAGLEAALSSSCKRYRGFLKPPKLMIQG